MRAPLEKLSDPVPDFPPRDTCLETIDILVLAGGLGTRIRPVLGDVPKLLAPIEGRPYLALLFAWLRRFGARRFVLGLGYRAQAILDYLTVNPPDGIVVETVVEKQPLGTAGAIRFARPALRTDPVLVLNGDSFVEADLCAFLAHHRASEALGTMLCAEVGHAGRYGRVETDERGFIRGFAEKDPAFHGKAAISAGVYSLSAVLLDEIARGTATSLERDVFERLPAGALAAYTTSGAFIDIGTPESLAAAGRIIATRLR